MNGKGSKPRPVNGAKYRANWERVFGKKRAKPGPYGCKCRTPAQRVCGDGCDVCNPQLAEEIRRDNEAQREEDLREASA